MMYLDYFLFKIHRTYKWLHRQAPRLVYHGPASAAASITAMYPLLLLFSITIYLNVWKENTSLYVKFIAAFLLVLAYVGLSFFLEAKAKKTYGRFINESRSQRILGAFAVNLVIIACIMILIVTAVKRF